MARDRPVAPVSDGDQGKLRLSVRTLARIFGGGIASTIAQNAADLRFMAPAFSREPMEADPRRPISRRLGLRPTGTRCSRS